MNLLKHTVQSVHVWHTIFSAGNKVQNVFRSSTHGNQQQKHPNGQEILSRERGPLAQLHLVSSNASVAWHRQNADAGCALAIYASAVLEVAKEKNYQNISFAINRYTAQRAASAILFDMSSICQSRMRVCSQCMTNAGIVRWLNVIVVLKIEVRKKFIPFLSTQSIHIRTRRRTSGVDVYLDPYLIDVHGLSIDLVVYLSSCYPAISLF
jgi:hypothetical protein